MARRSHVDRALLDYPVDWGDGGGLCVWQGLDAETGAAGPDLPGGRARRYRALPGAARLQPLWRPATLECAAATGRLAANASTARIFEHQQVSGVAFFPADDAGTDHCVDPIAPKDARRRGPVDHGLRPGTVLLLHAAHPADSRAGPGGVEDPARRSKSLALCQPPGRQSPSAGGLYLEPSAALLGLGGKCRDPLFRLPL